MEDLTQVLTYEERGLRFSLRVMDERRCQFVVERVSDGHLLASRLLVPEARDRFDEVVELWVAERLGVQEPAPVHCVACGSRLVAEGRMDTEYQFEGALWVTFSGGYGMFIDPCGDDEGDPRAVLCHDCAHELCDRVPWIATLINPTGGHSHHSEVAPALIESGHDGWDFEATRLDEGPELAEHLFAVHGVDVLPEGARARWALHYRLHEVNRGCGHRHRFPGEAVVD